MNRSSHPPPLQVILARASPFFKAIFEGSMGDPDSSAAWGPDRMLSLDSPKGRVDGCVEKNQW